MYTLLEQCMVVRGHDIKIALTVKAHLAQQLAEQLRTERDRLELAKKNVDQTSVMNEIGGNIEKSGSVIISGSGSGSGSEGETRAPIPATSPLPQASPVKVPTVPSHMAHIMHLARLMEENRESLTELNQELESISDWQPLYNDLVLPQMHLQETILYDLPPEMVNSNQFQYMGGNIPDNSATQNDNDYAGDIDHEQQNSNWMQMAYGTGQNADTVDSWNTGSSNDSDADFLQSDNEAAVNRSASSEEDKGVNQ
ncbi:MAG: hypothetical protein EZS28_038218 [Streblomastix strix]|uniref:Uncharacterized protein n=1 Tax=Streblomastix strix TaxID=222440 RepID=A0A5J4U5Z4_9EUKA|nr:MAG: hypothetical protein EZS28_038218 [Streblomastix strix]